MSPYEPQKMKAIQIRFAGCTRVAVTQRRYGWDRREALTIVSSTRSGIPRAVTSDEKQAKSWGESRAAGYHKKPIFGLPDHRSIRNLASDCPYSLLVFCHWSLVIRHLSLASCRCRQQAYLSTIYRHTNNRHRITCLFSASYSDSEEVMRFFEFTRPENLDISFIFKN